MALIIALDVEVVVVLDALHFVRYEELFNLTNLAYVVPGLLELFAVIKVLLSQNFKVKFALFFH